MDHREFIQIGGVSCLAITLPRVLRTLWTSPQSVLTTNIASSNILASDYPSMEVQVSSDTVLGSPLSIMLSEKIDLLLNNQLSVPTSDHGHGIRLRNAMDRVAGLTREAIFSRMRISHA